SQAAAPQPQADTLDALVARLSAHLAQPRFAPAAWGVKIVSLDTGKTWFEHNPQKYFDPASNAKLYSTALALDRLGADYRIRTSLYSSARPDASGALKGDLIVYGRGDPTMAASLNGGDYFKPLEPLVEQVVSAGVRRIEGDLIGDESYFPPLRSAPAGSGTICKSTTARKPRRLTLTTTPLIYSSSPPSVSACLAASPPARRAIGLRSSTARRPRRRRRKATSWFIARLAKTSSTFRAACRWGVKITEARWRFTTRRACSSRSSKKRSCGAASR